MTKVINLFGGSGLGKSTTAAGLFYEMKLRGIHCELVREYVKQWAWEDKKVGPMDQVYIFGKQAKTESRLYGKVDVIVTDSPLLLSPMYESFYSPDGKSIVADSAFAFLRRAREMGVVHYNFILERHKPFDTRGRYETEAMAVKVDEHVQSFLDREAEDYKVITAMDRERVEVILKELGLW